MQLVAVGGRWGFHWRRWRDAVLEIHNPFAIRFGSMSVASKATVAITY
jgi:hypothetical protein